MSTFKRLIRIFLRQLMGKAYMQDRALMGRYEGAVLSIIRKRRSNHNYSRKLTGHGKKCIYGFPTRSRPSLSSIHTKHIRRTRRIIFPVKTEPSVNPVKTKPVLKLLSRRQSQSQCDSSVSFSSKEHFTSSPFAIRDSTIQYYYV